MDDDGGAGPAVVLIRLGRVLTFGVVALGGTDVRRAAAFWSAALGYRLREDLPGEDMGTEN